ncbi:uncharacterized protein LOC143270796 [Peromyscus maniculatus bairdii]|uniref:uncharacterized protein LOC143270796 n=1 Tax=Peromyscus maniculatus bairdii TaxID=230844 RepID=UPI003FD37BC1
MRDADARRRGNPAHGLLSALPPPLGDRARWFCVAGAPGSSRRRSLQRRGQPARQGGASRWGGARGAIRSLSVPRGGFPPAELLTYCDSTPASLGTHSPGPVRRDSMCGRVSALGPRPRSHKEMGHSVTLEEKKLEYLNELSSSQQQIHFMGAGSELLNSLSPWLASHTLGFLSLNQEMLEASTRGVGDL